MCNYTQRTPPYRLSCCPSLALSMWLKCAVWTLPHRAFALCATHTCTRTHSATCLRSYKNDTHKMRSLTWFVGDYMVLTNAEETEEKKIRKYSILSRTELRQWQNCYSFSLSCVYLFIYFLLLLVGRVWSQARALIHALTGTYERARALARTSTIATYECSLELVRCTLNSI